MLHKSVIIIIAACAVFAQAVPFDNFRNYRLQNSHKEALGNFHLSQNVQNLKRSLVNNINDDKNEDFHWKEDCMSEKCDTFYDIITEGAEETIKPCANADSHVCNYNFGSSTDDVEKNIKRRILEQLEEILSEPPNKDDIKSLAIEKRIYNDCIHFNETRMNLENFVRSHEIPKYQFLPIIPGDFTFFDISVSRHPMNPNKNIIVLQPPKKNSKFILNIRETFELLQQYNINHFGVDEYYSPARSVLNKFLDVVENSTGSHNSLTTLDKWTEFYLKANPKSKISWFELFYFTFNNFDYKVNKNESIFVRDLQYFKDIFHLMEQPPQQIEAIAKTHFYAENLDYLKLASAQKHQIDRSKFCYEEVKHYGASYIILDKFKNAYNPEANQVFKEIVNVLENKIIESQELNKDLKIYLQTQLKTITDDIINDVWSKEEVSNYYEDFELTNDHLQNIINYRIMLKSVNLKKLRANSKLSVAPLSLSADDTQSNLLLHLMTSMSLKMMTVNLREVHFSTYGVKLAHELYSMLIEQVHFTGNVEFRNIRLKCMLPQKEGHIVSLEEKEWALDMAKRYYSLQISYEAMRRSDFDDVIRFPNRKSLSSNQLFFWIYIMDQCSSDNGPTLPIITSKSKELSSTFKCNELSEYKQDQCDAPAF